MRKNQRQHAIGILGGTFDPIHFGHLKPALEISEALSLHKLFLMPNHIAPHKAQSQCSAIQRCEMVKLAIQKYPQMELDTRELNRTKPSYTIDTLKELKIEHPKIPICFIMGMDSLLSFDSWFQWSEILNYCHLVIVKRPHCHAHFNKTIATLVNRCETANKQDLHQFPCGKIYFQDTQQFDISSTEIRSRLKNNKSIDAMAPSSVINYIKQFHLYQ